MVEENRIDTDDLILYYYFTETMGKHFITALTYKKKKKN